MKQPLPEIRKILRTVSNEKRILKTELRKRYEVREFQPKVKQVLEELLTGYDIVEFDSDIKWADAPSKVHRPDLAIIAKNCRHWTIVEVETYSHPVGYSYSSPLSKGHIYHQVEVFANGDYNEKHIAKLAKILNKDKKQLENLLSIQPDVLVIEIVLMSWQQDKNNWCRLTEISTKYLFRIFEMG